MNFFRIFDDLLEIYVMIISKIELFFYLQPIIEHKVNYNSYLFCKVKPSGCFTSESLKNLDLRS